MSYFPPYRNREGNAIPVYETTKKFVPSCPELSKRLANRVSVAGTHMCTQIFMGELAWENYETADTQILCSVLRKHTSELRDIVRHGVRDIMGYGVLNIVGPVANGIAKLELLNIVRHELLNIVGYGVLNIVGPIANGIAKAELRNIAWIRNTQYTEAPAV